MLAEAAADRRMRQRQEDAMADAHDFLSRDPAYEGACPCALFEVDGTRIRTHCWRPMCAAGCEFAGVHFAGDRAVAERVRDAVAATWASEWAIVEAA
jgi:hypothetical protein